MHNPLLRFLKTLQTAFKAWESSGNEVPSSSENPENFYVSYDQGVQSITATLEKYFKTVTFV